MADKKPKHEYQKVQEDLARELAVVPAELVKIAYAFRDFCEKAFPKQDYKQKIKYTHKFKMGSDWLARDEYVYYKVIVGHETTSQGPHGDLETEDFILLSAHNGNLLNRPTTTRLPWDKRKYRGPHA